MAYLEFDKTIDIDSIVAGSNFTFDIQDEETVYLLELSYVYLGYELLIKSLGANTPEGRENYNPELLDELLERFNEAYTMFRIAVTEVIKEHISDDFLEELDKRHLVVDCSVNGNTAKAKLEVRSQFEGLENNSCNSCNTGGCTHE